MTTVRYDDRSFFLDDRRIWLTSGAVHYFRTPHQLWADRLLKAKRAGLNCIDTYVAWNFHEMVEGKWDFSGDRDIVRFVTLARELGLYVILRPGPYICSEWDFGGFPAWLAVKPGVALRTNNAVYMHYFDKYLRQVLSRLRDLQVTHGGNIVLIQNENEYCFTTMPDRLAYCQFITQLFRRGGFEIPIITCNYLTEPKVPDAIECVNGWDNLVPSLKRLRAFEPNAPMLVTEFWNGWFDRWGGSHRTRDSRDTARKLLEILGCGSQFNYYMWHGGTNFGFWGSKLDDSESAYQTTSYDSDAPLAEGGGLTEKYYLTKLVNQFSTSFGPYLAQCRMEGLPATSSDQVQVLNIASASGLRFAVVTNNGRSDVRTCKVNLANGLTDLEVSLELCGATIIPMNLRLETGTIDYANVMPLGLFERSIALFHGPVGFEARVSINGEECRATIDALHPQMIEKGGMKFVLMSTDLARRTWDLDGQWVIGPEFLGHELADARPHGHDKQYYLLNEQGSLSYKKYAAAPAAKPIPTPRMAQFAKWHVCEDMADEHLKWEPLDRPKDVAALGIPHGYAWYRLELPCDKAGKRTIFLPDCEDRAHIYLNGEYLTTWGRGPGAVRKPLTVSLKKGLNQFVFLLDNMGRLKIGRMEEPKGLFGPVWDVRPIELHRGRLKGDGEFAKRFVPRMYGHMIPTLAKLPMWTAEFSFRLSQVQRVHLEWTHLPYHLAVLCNDRPAGFFVGSHGGYGQVTLSNELQKGNNLLRLMLWGDVPAKALDEIKAHVLGESLSVGGKWSFRRMDVPVREHRSSETHRPTWYRSHFTYTPQEQPLFLHLSGSGKGQIYLNGHNIGRYWNIGPQERYYLPEPWLAAENVLLLLEEQGLTPSAKLEHVATGPYSSR